MAIRSEPPTVTAFSYTLGTRICGVANKSEFQAFNKRQVANGELWFQVQITELEDSIGTPACPRTPFSGWMIAEKKNGEMVVDRLQTAPDATQQASRTTSESSSPEKDEETPDDAGYSFFDFVMRYVMLILGTGLAVAIVTMQRKESIDPRNWLSPIIGVEFVALATVNVLFGVLLIKEYFLSAGLLGAETNFLFRLVAIFEKAPAGFLMLGFLLTLLWTKFMSFNRT